MSFVWCVLERGFDDVPEGKLCIGDAGCSAEGLREWKRRQPIRIRASPKQASHERFRISLIPSGAIAGSQSSAVVHAVSIAARVRCVLKSHQTSAFEIY